jgi:hypothetical protein
MRLPVAAFSVLSVMFFAAPLQVSAGCAWVLWSQQQRIGGGSSEKEWVIVEAGGSPPLRVTLHAGKRGSTI